MLAVPVVPLPLLPELEPELEGWETGATLEACDTPWSLECEEAWLTSIEGGVELAMGG